MNNVKNKAKNLAFQVKVDHTNLLRNCYGSMVVQTCLPEIFWKVCFGKLFPSTETNSKQTSFWPDFAQITSHQFILRFRLRYMGAFSNSPVNGSMRTVIKPSNICIALQYLPSRLSNTFSWQCVIAHTKWWNGKILNMCYWRWVYNRWPPDLLWAANHWTVLGDLTRTAVPSAHTASVLLGIRAQDVITANMLERHTGRVFQCRGTRSRRSQTVTIGFKEKHVIYTAVLSQNMTWKDEWFWFCFRTVILHWTSTQ